MLRSFFITPYLLIIIFSIMPIQGENYEKIIRPFGFEYILENRINLHNFDVVDFNNDEITILAKVTAYAPYDNQSGICNDGNPNYTSTGTSPGFEYVAVDPSKIPYGTKLLIPEYGEVIAADTGGALRNYDKVAIDVFFETYEDAMNWGVQFLEVKILTTKE